MKHFISNSRRRRATLRVALFHLGIGLIALLLGSEWAERRELAIIIHPSLDVQALSLEEVRQIYLGEVEFVGKKRIKPVDQEEGQEIRKEFLNDILHISKSDYSRRWMHLIFLGGTEGPILRKEGRGVIETVRRTKGAIGYVWADEAAGAEGVRIVLRYAKARPTPQLSRAL